MAPRCLPITLTLLALLSFGSLAGATIVVNGDFELQGASPTDAAAWTGENGTTILRSITEGFGGTAGMLISNVVTTSAAGPLRLNTGTAGGDAVLGGLLYTFRFDSQRTFANGGVFEAQVIARDNGDNFLGVPLDVTLTTGSVVFDSFTKSFTAPAGTTRFEVNFYAITGGDQGSSSRVVVDNVQIAIPEPSTSMLLVGALGMRFRRRTRRG